MDGKFGSAVQKIRELMLKEATALAKKQEVIHRNGSERAVAAADAKWAASAEVMMNTIELMENKSLLGAHGNTMRQLMHLRAHELERKVREGIGASLLHLGSLEGEQLASQFGGNANSASNSESNRNQSNSKETAGGTSTGTGGPRSRKSRRGSVDRGAKK